MKCSIRDLLLVTVIVALAVGWWVDHQRQAAEIERLTAMIRPPRLAELRLSLLLYSLEERGETVDFSDNYASIQRRKNAPRLVLPNSSAPAPKLPSD